MKQSLGGTPIRSCHLATGLGLHLRHLRDFGCLRSLLTLHDLELYAITFGE
jgi:hypothetical protein